MVEFRFLLRLLVINLENAFDDVKWECFVELYTGGGHSKESNNYYQNDIWWHKSPISHLGKISEEFEVPSGQARILSLIPSCYRPCLKEVEDFTSRLHWLYLFSLSAQIALDLKRETSRVGFKRNTNKTKVVINIKDIDNFSNVVFAGAVFS